MIPVIAAYFLIFLTHLSLVFFKVLPGDFKVMAQIDSFLAFIFVVALLIAVPGIKKGGENFAQRFLIVTTVQLLSMLGLILVLTFAKIPGTKVLGFNAISVFVILLLIQSVFLIKKIKQD